MRHPSNPTSAPLIAAAWMVGALFSFTAMAVAGREISFELDTFQLMFYRSLIGLIVIVAVAALSPGGLAQFRTRRLGLHLGRNVVHFVGQFGWFYGIALIPLAQVFAIEFTIPLWVALLAPFVLHERLSAVRWAAVLVGFAGILIIVRPGAAPVSGGHLAVVIAALAFACTIMVTKRLASTESSLTILFYMALVQAPMGLIPSLGHLQMPTAITWGWLVVVTLCGLSAHFCMAQALRLAD
ncbi:MAG: DMT family transporter, partial [Kiloniellales bacterium]